MYKILIINLCLVFSWVNIATAALTITRHEVVKQDGVAKGLIIGVTYKDDITGREIYRDTIFPASDFSATPTKVEIKEKLKIWLTTITTTENKLPDGTIEIIKEKSILQTMKEEASKVPEIATEIKVGNPKSFIGETVPEQ